jgi:hypothetical protein
MAIVNLSSETPRSRTGRDVATHTQSIDPPANTHDENRPAAIATDKTGHRRAAIDGVAVRILIRAARMRTHGSGFHNPRLWIGTFETRITTPAMRLRIAAVRFRTHVATRRIAAALVRMR